MDELNFEGSWNFAPRIHRDAQGGFSECFRDANFQITISYRPEIAQGNCSVSRRGILCGIHFADVPPGQSKYVTRVSGADHGRHRRPASRINRIRDVASGETGDQNHHAVFIADGPSRTRSRHSRPGGLELVLSDEDTTARLLAETLSKGPLLNYGERLPGEFARRRPCGAAKYSGPSMESGHIL